MKIKTVGSQSPSLYSLKSTSDSVKLFYSALGDWCSSIKGKLAASITENDGTVTIAVGGKRMHVGYCDALELHVALSEWARNQPDTEIRTFAEEK